MEILNPDSIKHILIEKRKVPTEELFDSFVFYWINIMREGSRTEDILVGCYEQWEKLHAIPLNGKYTV